MREGIAIVGLNGSGKSTLGHALAKTLNLYEIDVEDYYFPEQRESRKATLDGKYGVDCSYLGDMPYSVPRTKEEVEEAISKEVLAHPRYVMTGVTINWNAEILSTIKHVFWLRTETEERVRRVKEREEKRWGDRVTEGGDMYEQQKSFCELIAGLTEDKVRRSIGKLDCKLIQLDGSRSVSENLVIMKKVTEEV